MRKPEFSVFPISGPARAGARSGCRRRNGCGMFRAPRSSDPAAVHRATHHRRQQNLKTRAGDLFARNLFCVFAEFG